jgi:hypothetical protein
MKTYVWGGERWVEVELHHSSPRQQMEMSGQIHATATLLGCGNGSRYISDSVREETRRRSWRYREELKNLSLPGIEPLASSNTCVPLPCDQGLKSGELGGQLADSQGRSVGHETAQADITWRSYWNLRLLRHAHMLTCSHDLRFKYPQFWKRCDQALVTSVTQRGLQYIGLQRLRQDD